MRKAKVRIWIHCKHKVWMWKPYLGYMNMNHMHCMNTMNKGMVEC
jgi:hypothetical protein